MPCDSTASSGKLLGDPMFEWFRTAFQRKGSSESAAGQQAPVASAYQAEEELQQAYRLLAEGQPKQAEACCRRALQADAGAADAHHLLGAALRAQGRLMEAIASYRKVTALKPDQAQSHLDMGEVLSEQGNLDEAIIAYKAAASLLPDYAELHSNLGTLYRKRGHAGQAEACYRKAIELKPDFHAAHFNLGNLLRNQGRLPETEACYQAAIACNPDLVAAHHNLGDVLKDQGRFDEAMSCYERALTVAPDYPASRWHQTMLSLLTGDLQRGLPGYEYRWQLVKEEQPRNLKQPLWLGDADIRGKAILLYAEKGFGDTLQFVRYAGQVAALGARVLLEVQAPLKSLLSAYPGMDKVLARGEPLPPFDYQCPLMSLPLAFKTEVATIPAASRYISAPADRVTHWAGQLKQYRSPRIGLVWSGNIGQSNDMNRSMTLETLGALMSGSRHHFFALVKEVREHDKALLRSMPNVTDLSPQLTDFSETAAILENLDLLIAVDTSVAHLAGALGKPAWIMLSFVPDWRWFTNRPDSPWYPSVRLFRQPANNDWESVVESLRTELDLLDGNRSGSC